MPPVVSVGQMLFDRQESVVLDGYKYIVSSIDGDVELFSLEHDPEEQHSLAREDPARIAAGRAALERHHRESAALRARLDVDSTGVSSGSGHAAASPRVGLCAVTRCDA